MAIKHRQTEVEKYVKFEIDETTKNQKGEQFKFLAGVFADCFIGDLIILMCIIFS